MAHALVQASFPPLAVAQFTGFGAFAAEVLGFDMAGKIFHLRPFSSRK
jgi:hypothetical protein